MRKRLLKKLSGLLKTSVLALVLLTGVASTEQCYASELPYNPFRPLSDIAENFSGVHKVTP